MSVTEMLGATFEAAWRYERRAAACSQSSFRAFGDFCGLNHWFSNRKPRADAIASISDQREATCLLMVSVAQTDGCLSHTEREAIVDQIEACFATTRGTGPGANDTCAVDGARWHRHTFADAPVETRFRNLAHAPRHARWLSRSAKSHALAATMTK